VLHRCPRISTVFIGAILKCDLFVAVVVVWKMSKKKLVELYVEEEELLLTAAVMADEGQKATEALVDSISAFSTSMLLYIWQCIS